MSVNIVRRHIFQHFLTGVVSPVPAFERKRRNVSVLTALQVNKPQLPVSILIFPRYFDGQSAETGVGDGAGTGLVS